MTRQMYRVITHARRSQDIFSLDVNQNYRTMSVYIEIIEV